MTTDTNKPAPIAEPACTWREPDRAGMRYPGQSDLSGGATDCAPAPAVDERTADSDSGHLAAAPNGSGGAALTFDAFRAANVARCIKWHPEGIDSWSPSDWLTAVTGELGELASLLKMRNRERDGLPGNKFSPTQKQIADELADVLTYLDLLAEVLGVDLGRAAALKFNEVSERVGFPDRIAVRRFAAVSPEADGQMKRTEDMDKDLTAAPEQRGELPEPVAWMHDGYASTNKWCVLYDEQRNRNCGFKARPVYALYTADQMNEYARAAIAAERARTADTHAAYCHSQQQFHDAVAELPTLRQQLAEAVRERDALRAQVDAAVPAMRDYARRNPRWESLDNGEVEGKMQDPNGVNAWLEQIDAAIAARGEANPPAVERELFEGE